jgi:DNA invertase Pin-like site-specific DNA recombinase
LQHLIATITDNRGVGFKSLTENIDTTTSGGKELIPSLTKSPLCAIASP